MNLKHFFTPFALAALFAVSANAVQPYMLNI